MHSRDFPLILIGSLLGGIVFHFLFQLGASEIVELMFDNGSNAASDVGAVTSFLFTSLLLWPLAIVSIIVSEIVFVRMMSLGGSPLNSRSIAQTAGLLLAGGFSAVALLRFGNQTTIGTTLLAFVGMHVIVYFFASLKDHTPDTKQ